jgi:hypothetical protein
MAEEDGRNEASENQGDSELGEAAPVAQSAAPEVIIPEDTREAIQDEIEARVEQVVMERFASQFPHPEHLERYAALYPDAPRLVFENFDKQSTHRREMEKVFLEGNETRANRGQWLAYSLVVLAFAAGTLAIIFGQAGAGATIITAAFAGGVILYIAGGVQRVQPPARTQDNERDSARATSAARKKKIEK